MKQEVLSIQLLTGLDEDTQALLPRYYAQLSEEQKAKIWLQQQEIIQRLAPKRNNQLSHIFFQGCWLKAIDEARRQAKSKTTSRDLDERDRQVQELRLERFKRERTKKAAPIRKYIERHLTTLTELIEKEGMSFREVSRWLHIYHRKSISASYLQKIFRELKNKAP